MTIEFRLVETPQSLCEATKELELLLDNSPHPRLYLDTEFESNRSGTKICLLQVSAGKTNFLFDPVRLNNLAPLGRLLGQEKVEWILHAGLQDVDLITDFFGLHPPSRIFDTQIAWALLSPEASVGLAYLQFKLLGIRSKKAHQADDWYRRPLQESMLRYAASDVEHLPKMTELLLAQAKNKGRSETIYAASKDALSPRREPPPPLSLGSFRNAWQLGAENQAGMLYLIEWYNSLPLSERRYAPENKSLLSIASRLPEDVGALSRIKGVPRSTVNRYGKSLVAGLHQAASKSQDSDFRPIDPPPYCTFEEIQQDAWLSSCKAELAVSLGFAPELVLPGRLLKAMKASLKIEGVAGLESSLVGWRREFLLDHLVEFCKKNPPPISTQT